MREETRDLAGKGIFTTTKEKKAGAGRRKIAEGMEKYEPGREKAATIGKDITRKVKSSNKEEKKGNTRRKETIKNLPEAIFA